ncbi:MAG: hypothetical protein ACK52I_31410, partial [Pseudomonadota bacterium]
ACVLASGPSERVDPPDRKDTRKPPRPRPAAAMDAAARESSRGGQRKSCRRPGRGTRPVADSCHDVVTAV